MGLFQTALVCFLATFSVPLVARSDISKFNAARDVSVTLMPNFAWAPPQDVAAPGVPAWTAYFSQFKPATASSLNDITTCTGPTANVWGASFDDGPSNNTQVVLNYFQSISMHTTFWVIGSRIQDYPQILQASFQAGHQIGCHTWSHSNLTTLTDDQVISEFVYGIKAILDTIGVVPKYFRPPYGEVDDRVRTLAASMGLASVTWELDSNDWMHVGTGDIAQTVPPEFQGWIDSNIMLPISLEHDMFPDTVSVVKQNMDILINAGRVLKPLSECIGDAKPYDNPILSRFFASGLFENPALDLNASRGNLLPAKASPAAVNSAMAERKSTAVVAESWKWVAVVCFLVIVIL